MDRNLYMTHNMQVRLLRNMGLVIKDKSRAKRILREIGFNNLLENYALPFLREDTSSNHFIDNTTIEEIYALYEFDRHLRVLTLEYIFLIETKLKTLICYQFTVNYGDGGYLNLENFDSSKSADILCRFLTLMKEIVEKAFKRDAKVMRYAMNNSYVPLWMLIDTMTLGEISKFYLNLRNQDRVKVSMMFKHDVKENILANSLHFMTLIRNICAHNKSLYTIKLTSRVKTGRYYKYFKKVNTNDYFAMVVVFKELLSEDDFRCFFNKLVDLFCELNTKLFSITSEMIFQELGLPDNWEVILGL